SLLDEGEDRRTIDRREQPLVDIEGSQRRMFVSRPGFIRAEAQARPATEGSGPLVGSITAAVPYATTSVMKLDNCDASKRMDKMAFAPNPFAFSTIRSTACCRAP